MSKPRIVFKRLPPIKGEQMQYSIQITQKLYSTFTISYILHSAWDQPQTSSSNRGEHPDLFYFGIISISIHSDTHLIFYFPLSKTRIDLEWLLSIKSEQMEYFIQTTQKLYSTFTFSYFPHSDQDQSQTYPSNCNNTHPKPYTSPNSRPTKKKSTSTHGRKTNIFKKTSTTQQARMDAMAARSMKKKRDLQNAVISSIKNAIKCLHRTEHHKKTSFHQMPICICCDNFIIGTERVHRMAKETLKKYQPALGVESYEHFHNERMHPMLIRQYRVKSFSGMLLSPRANKNKKGYSVCSSCYTSLNNKSKSNTKPPKFSIANGFAIGSFPNIIPVATGKNKGSHRRVDIEDESDISEVMRTLISPVRPYGYVMAYTGGKHAKIKGHYQFFEMNHEKINAGMHALSENDTNVHVMMCGPMTKEQKSKIRSMAHIDTQKYIDIMTWLIQNSSKDSIRTIPLPERCFVPTLYDDSTKAAFAPGEKRDKSTETTFGGGTYYFSSAHTPSNSTSVFQSTRQFATALLKNHSPQLFVYGGNRKRPHEADLEDILPLVFPFGTGGPKFKRRTSVSVEECIRCYMRTALPQFMRSEVIFIMQHAFSRLKSYNSGIIKLRSKVGERDAGDLIGNTTPRAFLHSIQHRNENYSDPMTALTMSISTSCEVLGYTEEAAKKARQNCFAMTDHFGLSSLFLTTTPCDECSFRVRLFANPMGQVRTVCLSI